MTVRSVCLLGGCGFVGRSLAERLAADGLRLRIVTRHRDSAQPLLVLPTAEIEVADPNDDATLARLFEGMDAVVNLVAILHERRRATFQSVNVEFARKVAGACRAAGVGRLLHVSALGASESAPSDYLRSKARGEAAVREAAGSTAVTILRPSIIFGPGDSFLNLFATLVRLFPVIPLAGAKTRFQPIWVEDVANAMANALGDSRTFGRDYNLCGPRAYTFEELVRFVAAVLERRRMVVALPDWAAKLQATVFEFLPGPLMTRDNLRSMSVDNVCDGPFPEVFGFRPTALETVVPEYLADKTTTGRYPDYRNRAGR
ncbi:complex I NDUFA9 subunit family protein [Usitatibacter palustris]|uniref:NAD-dependent epimerase/dehydratase domain-containing protein n=1 Tax=Usitatibacter palustris TaxID=2732487 RepID=A0A6M4HCD1_9PROT|nr:complex I NDUFA9 subunit family protein [Usitatibacter palustris]QJR16243.1 hypothetical protein DSM104440_03072 [Usitatibacter palustris]